jgi:ABC-type antimicrobial peptide transport system permease subunit
VPLPLAGMAAVASVAGYLPARYATTIHPMRRWAAGHFESQGVRL